MTTETAKRQLTPVPFTQVTLDDPFWAPRQEINRRVSIPHMYQMLIDTGRIGAFDLAFERPVPSSIVLIFGDSDPA
ncbi:MAG: glycoside hydrolase family 127 protein, partial [Caldilinea sp.]|nr:glycoside hydrolase family 127 protein [Caldilinea sp.]